jgi:hypothetical protein
MALYKGEMTEKDYNAQVLKIKKDTYTEMQRMQNSNGTIIHEGTMKLQELNLETAEKEYQQRKKAAEDFTSTMSSIWSSYFSAENQSLESFLATTLTTMLDSLEKQLLAQEAAAIASVQIKNITTKGLIGLATAVAETTAIAAAFEGAKALLSGLSNKWTGGYTGDGEWNEPKAIVHSNEFVANRFAVSNPQVRPVLDLINMAQRQNTVSSLTAADISRVLPTQQGTSQASVNVVQTTDPELVSVLAECRKTISEMKKKLDEPIFAYTRVSGKYGINEAQQLNKTLKSNASR